MKRHSSIIVIRTYLILTSTSVFYSLHFSVLFKEMIPLAGLPKKLGKNQFFSMHQMEICLLFCFVQMNTAPTISVSVCLRLKIVINYCKCLWFERRNIFSLHQTDTVCVLHTKLKKVKDCIHISLPH